MNVSINLKIFPIFSIFYRFAPHFLIAPLYYQQILGSYTLAMTVLSVMLISCAASEIPLGVLSDFIGRKKTIILAALTSLIGYVLFIFPGVEYIGFGAEIMCFIGAVMLGISQALYSGTLETLLYESAKESKQLKKYNKYFCLGNGLGSASGAVSALLSGVIAYYWGYLWCFILSAIGALGAVIISLFWQNTSAAEVNRVNIRSVGSHLRYAFLLFKNRPKLRLISLAKILGDNVSYRIDVIYFRLLLPESLLGMPRMLKKMFGCASYIFAPWLINKLGALKTLVVSNTWMIVMRGLALVTNNITSPFIISMVDMLDGTAAASFSGMLQGEYSDRQRATMGSIVSMGTTIWTSVMMFLIGVVIDHTSIRTALAVLVAYRFIRYYIYYELYKISLKKKKRK